MTNIEKSIVVALATIFVIISSVINTMNYVNLVQANEKLVSVFGEGSQYLLDLSMMGALAIFSWAITVIVLAVVIYNGLRK
ncbi:hypothetical protein GH146_00575 [archaeon]|nr:hypothetical protein [archaeon]